MKLSVIIITYERLKELNLCIDSVLIQTHKPDEIVIVDNSSSDLISNDISLIKQNAASHNIDIIYHHSDFNLGVAGGRNKGASLASGDIFIFIDDDAIFNSIHECDAIQKLFTRNSALGVIAALSLDYISGKPRRWELPLSDKNTYLKQQEVTYFVGVAHAIRSSLYKSLKGYHVDGLYGAEEMDISYRIMKTKFSIIYDPEFCVRHMKSNSGRADEITNIKRMVSARITITLRYFPIYISVINTLLYASLITVKYKISPLRIARSLCIPWLNMVNGSIKRQVLDRKTIEKIRTLKGRIYY